MKNKKEKKGFFRGRSITFTMFWLSFGSITVVLLIGFLIIGVIAPKVYSTSVMNEIEKNLLNTIEYYDISLRDIAENPQLEIFVTRPDEFDNENNDFYNSTVPSVEIIIPEDEQELLIQKIEIQYLLNSIAMSRGASIEITDADGEIVYETPKWFNENIRGIRTNNSPQRFFNKHFLLDDSIEDNAWVTRTSTLSLDEEYTLNVRMDLKSFNQNIMIFNRMFIYMLVVGGIFALIFSVILSFIVTKPLKELRKIAGAMENMDFSIRYDKNRQDEIGQLGKTLNHMMDRLGTNINKLQAELQKEKHTDKLRKEFVAQVSHELKTPVAIVSNYTEALLDGVADTKEEQDSYLSTIENECHKMGHIINDLLDLSQMEAGTFKINKMDFEFKDLLEDLIGKYKYLIKDKFEFISDIKIESAQVLGDELRIEQAISNLLSNALKHTKENGYIKFTASKEGEMVHVQVENEGEPIDKDLLLHIWDSFAKGENQKGAGLGLSITKNIIELHEGEYYVQNLSNAVVFGLRLPVK